MSVTTELQTVPPGSPRFLDDVWALKETIREETGFLRQEYSFFSDAYRNTTTYVLTEGDTIVAFLSIQDNGYILFLGVDPAAQGRGYGKHLIEHASASYDTLTCHARTTNTNAIGFYETMGFEISHEIEGYYVDGGAAYYLILTTTESPWEEWMD